MAAAVLLYHIYPSIRLFYSNAQEFYRMKLRKIEKNAGLPLLTLLFSQAGDIMKHIVLTEIWARSSFGGING